MNTETKNRLEPVGAPVTKSGHVYAIWFDGANPRREAYHVTKDGEIVEAGLLLREARELIHDSRPI
jgi:hypothetical protein